MKDTILGSFLSVVGEFPKKEALFYKKGHHFESVTYEEIYKYAQNLAIFLKDLKVKEGDRVVLVSENRPEWVIADFASQILGAVLVPVHSVLASAQIKTITDEVAPKVIFVSDKEVLEKILEIEDFKKGQTPIVYFGTDLEAGNLLQKKKKLFLFKEKVYDAPHQKPIEPVKADPERVITIIYTSGTTGRFKGVMLTNHNLVSDITGVLTMIEITSNDRFLSVLPLSHVFERTVGYYIPIVCGSTIAYVEDPGRLSEIAQAERPTIIIGVPRLFEKVYQAVKDKAAKNILKLIVFQIAFAIGKHASKKSRAYQIADKIVFKQIKEAFGGQIRFFVSGASNLAREIGQFFDTLSIPVIEGYGLTETSPIVSCNTLEHRRYGTVGHLLPEVKAKVVKGELLLKGPNVFKEYYKNPEKTAEAFTKDGWFKTGDLAEISKDGYLKILAREKEIIALSTGKKVSPAFLEERLELSPYIAQAFVFGDQRKHVGAILVPAKERFTDLAKEKHDEVLKKEIDEHLNKRVSSYEQIIKYVLVHEPFSVDNGLLTPSLKLRRNEIMAHYQKEIESVYEED